MRNRLSRSLERFGREACLKSREIVTLGTLFQPLRADAPVLTDLEALRWRAATDAFAAEQMGARGPMTRIASLRAASLLQLDDVTGATL